MEKPRLFASDAAVCRIGEGLLDRTLARAEWTHEAHLAACLWIVRDRPEIVAERDLPAIIAAYNIAAGGVNDDSQGYHETITQCFLGGVRAYLARAGEGALVDQVNGLLLAPEGQRDWPLRFYTRARLASVAARRGLVPPDIV